MKLEFFFVFKLSPCFKHCMLSSGLFPGVWILRADVSEHYVCLYNHLPMKMELSVPKRRHTKLRRRGITQKKAYKRKLEFPQQFIEKYSNIKFYENPSSGSLVVQCEKADGRTDMTKLRVAFRNFVNASKSLNSFSTMDLLCSHWKKGNNITGFWTQRVLRNSAEIWRFLLLLIYTHLDRGFDVHRSVHCNIFI